MLRFSFLSILLLLLLDLPAQGFSSCQVVIGTTGGKALENGRRYAYTLGETVVGTLVSPMSGRTVTQGFHQPDVCLPVSTTQPELWSNWEVQAYPNPTVEFLQLQFSTPDVAVLDYQVVDFMGRVVRTHASLSTAGDRIDCSLLPAGHYVVLLQHPTTQGVLSIPFQKL